MSLVALFDETEQRLTQCSWWQRGEGVFETLLVRKGEPLFLTEHLLRAFGSLSTLTSFVQESSDLFVEKQSHAILKKLEELEVNDDLLYRLKLIIGFSERLPVFIELLPYTENANSLSLVSDVEFCWTSPLTTHKTLSYLPHSLMEKKAKSLGFDDGLRIDQMGNLLETSKANIFCYINGEWVTPPCSDLLPGIVRAQMIPILEARQISIPVDSPIEKMIVTNSLIGARPVRQLNQTQLVDSADLCESLRVRI